MTDWIWVGLALWMAGIMFAILDLRDQIQDIKKRIDRR